MNLIRAVADAHLRAEGRRALAAHAALVDAAFVQEQIDARLRLAHFQLVAATADLGNRRLAVAPQFEE
jgi:hypothetical protein